MSDSASLRPREHGAYAMLTAPVLSGLLLGGVSLPGGAFAAAAVAAFLAHEGVRVVLGERGERIRGARGAAARRLLWRSGAVSVVGAAAFAATAPRGAWLPAAVTALLGALVAWTLLAGRTKTLGGELLVAMAFASVHGVVAAAASAPAVRVWTPAAVWAGSFVLATVAVHALKHRFKGRGPAGWTVWAAPLAAGLVGGAAVVGLVAGHGAAPGLIALVPKAGVVMALAVLRANPRHLKRVGWSLVAADVATLALLAVGLPVG